MNKRIFRIPKYTAWFYPRRIWYGKKESIYLTFDDGPHPEITPWLLEELKKENIKVSFFWKGENIEKYPKLVEQAKEEGHLIGHHGYQHLVGRKTSWAAFKTNFKKSKDLVPTSFYRPPYGSVSQKQAKYILENGKLVMWSWMPYDFDNKLSVKTILEMFQKEIKGGDIVVLHENEKTNGRIQEIIPEILKQVQRKGLIFETIDKIEL